MKLKIIRISLDHNNDYDLKGVEEVLAVMPSANPNKAVLICRMGRWHRFKQQTIQGWHDGHLPN